MKKFSRWYCRLFYHLQLKEKRYFRFIFVLIIMITLSQIVLMNLDLRKFLVLTERLEGTPVNIYKSLSH